MATRTYAWVDQAFALQQSSALENAARSIRAEADFLFGYHGRNIGRAAVLFGSPDSWDVESLQEAYALQLEAFALGRESVAILEEALS